MSAVPATVEAFVRATAPVTIPQWVMDEIAMLPRGYTGKINLNYLDGGITNVNFERSVRKPK